MRGSTVDHAENRVKVSESTLESRYLDIVLADRRVARVQDQPPAVTYVTPDGRIARHTFDYLVEKVDGKRIACAVRPRSLVEKSGIEEILDLIRAQSLVGFADRAVLITEREASRRLAHNAQEILRARQMRNQRDVDALAAIASGLRGEVRLFDLVQSSGLGARGRNAVVCLIDEGVLELVARTRIGWGAMLRRTAPAQPAADR